MFDIGPGSGCRYLNCTDAPGAQARAHESGSPRTTSHEVITVYPGGIEGPKRRSRRIAALVGVGLTFLVSAVPAQAAPPGHGVASGQGVPPGNGVTFGYDAAHHQTRGHKVA
jgi:hypothetical protein